MAAPGRNIMAAAEKKTMPAIHEELRVAAEEKVKAAAETKVMAAAEEKVKAAAETKVMAAAEVKVKAAAETKVMAAAEVKKKICLRFHENHGKGVQLLKGKQVARRISKGFNGGIVMSEDPMMPDCLYEVKINEVHGNMGNIYLGVVTKNPNEYRPLPDRLQVLHSGILCVGPDFRTVFGDIVKNRKIEKLSMAPAGCRVGLCVDRDRSLHLYVDGVAIEVLCNTTPAVCYFVFDMWYYCRQVTCLPVKCTKCQMSDPAIDHKCQLPDTRGELFCL